MDFIVNDKQFNGKRVVNIFAYLPTIPGATQSFSIGLTSKMHVINKLYPVKGNRFIIDTLLPVPPPNWHYFIGCDFNPNNGTKKTFFIEEDY